MSATVDLVSEERHGKSQGYLLDRIVKVHAGKPPVERLRIEVYCDSYNTQSYARISLWGGTKWNVVTSLSGENPLMDGPSYVGWKWPRNDPQHRGALVHKEDCIEWQDKIAQHLLDKALAVVL